jgi:hypothetical protein
MNKLKLLLPCILSFTLLLANAEKASAKPDSLFTPYISDFLSYTRQKDMVLKLPSKIDLGDWEITPLMSNFDDALRIVFCISSTIHEGTCISAGYMGHLRIEKANNVGAKKWLSKGFPNESGETSWLKLNKNLTAKCWRSTNPRGTKFKPFCVWQEKEQVFTVYGLFDVKAVATSMANEQPITNRLPSTLDRD